MKKKKIQEPDYVLCKSKDVQARSVRLGDAIRDTTGEFFIVTGIWQIRETGKTKRIQFTGTSWDGASRFAVQIGAYRKVHILL